MDGTLAHLEVALEAAFPDLRPIRPLSFLGQGFRSLAVETPDHVVVKVGIQPEATEDYAREWRIGRSLSDRFDKLLPVPKWYAAPSQVLPYGGLAYAKLPGTSPVWASNPGPPFARDLGSFLADLHATPLDVARRAGLPEADSYVRFLGARDVVIPVLARRLPMDLFKRIEAWWEDFAPEQRMRSPRIALCHPDLWHGNLLCSEDGRLSGVLDLAHMEIADLAHDFAAPHYFGSAFMKELVSGYIASGGSLEPEDEYRVKRYVEAREFGGLAWAIEHNDQNEVEESIGKILRGPLFTAT